MKLSLHCPEIKRQTYPEIKFTVDVRHYYAQAYEMSNIYGKGFESRLLIVRFVKQKGPAELKMTLWKTGEEYYDHVYKIGGAKNGIELQLKPNQYTPSGQPLPGTKFTVFTTLLLVVAMLAYTFFIKRRSQI